MEAFGKFCTITLIVILSTLIRGYLIMKIWVWFIIPVFTSLPIINLTQALGFSFFIGLFQSFLTPKKRKGEEDSFKDMVTRLIGMTFSYLFYLLLAWILTLFY